MQDCLFFSENNDNSYINYFSFEQNKIAPWEKDFDFSRDEQGTLPDSLSLSEIKSISEVTPKHTISCSSNVAEEDAPLSQDFIKNIKKENFENDCTLKKLENDLKAKINSKEIDNVIDEAIGDLFITEKEAKDPCVIQKKNKKKPEQIKALRKALKENPVWSSDFQIELGHKIGLEKQQVYKWYWDNTKQKAKKNGKKRGKTGRASKFENIGKTFGAEIGLDF